MRVVSGIYGGRKLMVPKGLYIRPTSDKVRGAVFNMLRSRGAVEGANVLDVFCGSGALGLEALSQGAATCIFIDKSKSSLDVTQNNAEALGIKNEARFMLKDVAKLGQRPVAIPGATLAFLDPPYNQDFIGPALLALRAGDWLTEEALVVIETEREFNESLLPAFNIVDSRVYGSSKITLAICAS